MKTKYWLLVGSFVIASVQSLACSSSSSCEGAACSQAGSAGSGEAGDSATAGDGSTHAGAGNSAGAGNPAGAAGEGGARDSAGAAGAGASEAGAGGEPPVPDCVKDIDCSNHVACDGEELCDDSGTCRPGVPPCSAANPEPANCDVVCSEPSGKAVCTVRGKDADKDGHYSSACVTAPGDDCDDSAPTVYVGATELCDGLDNDCNQQSDLEDGLFAGGTTEEIGPIAAPRSLPAIAWAPDQSVFGIAYRDTTSTTADVYFEQVSPAGAVVVAPKPVNEASSLMNTKYPGLAMTWGGGVFGVTWNVASNGLCLRTVGSEGTVATTSCPTATFKSIGPYLSPVVARAAGGYWAVITELAQHDVPDPIQFLAGVVVGTGAPKDGVDLVVDNPTTWSIAPAGIGFVLAASDLNNKTTATLLDPVLNETQVLGASGRNGQVTAGANGGFAITLRGDADGERPVFYNYKADGTYLCPPFSFADVDFEPAGVVATPTGYLIIAKGQLRAQEFLNTCKFGHSFSIPDSHLAADVHIAGGSQGYGVVWSDVSTGHIKRRIFGTKYCN